MGAYVDTLRHYFGGLGLEMDGVADFRNPKLIHYRPHHFLMGAVKMFLTHSRSCHEFWRRSRQGHFGENLRRWTGGHEPECAHPDTITGFLERLPTEELEGILVWMIRKLIRSKVLDDWRQSDGRFLLAVDGTGYLNFKERHCDQCLTRKHKESEVVTYHHQALVAFLVGPQGWALPVAVQMMENPAGGYDKQDCETKAFVRIADKIKRFLPQTPFCLLLDALYAGGTVMKICQNKGWRFLINFKASDMPALWREAEDLKKQSPLHRVSEKLTTPQGNVIERQASWVNDLDYQGLLLSAVFLEEQVNGRSTSFAWLGNRPVDRKSVLSVASAGRQRWRAENEGFNVLKNGGFDLEHVYARDWNASKNYFLLMLIAHLIQQLTAKGILRKHFKEWFGSCRHLAFELAAELIHTLLDLHRPPPAQIRLSG